MALVADSGKSAECRPDVRAGRRERPRLLAEAAAAAGPLCAALPPAGGLLFSSPWSCAALATPGCPVSPSAG